MKDPLKNHGVRAVKALKVQFVVLRSGVMFATEFTILERFVSPQPKRQAKMFVKD